METVIEKIYNKHKLWVSIVKKFGCNSDTAEDIVQEMYLRMIVYLKKTDNDISFGEDINTFFIQRTLNSIFIDHIRKEKRKETVNFDEEAYQIAQHYDYNYSNIYEKMQESLKKMYWFDKKIYDIIESGVKISDLAKKTTIPYYTIYNTYQKVVEELKKEI